MHRWKSEVKSAFQSLIGTLQTYHWFVLENPTELFQSLIGTLQTKELGIKEVEVVVGFNPL